MKAVFINQDPEMLKRVYGESVRSVLKTAGVDTEPVFDRAAVLANPSCFADTEYLFSTWGMPSFTEEEIARCFPKLKAVFYAAGSVKSFAAPFLKSGISVHSARAANGVPVAAYTAAQILLANKGFFRTASVKSPADYEKARETAKHYPGNFGTSVGIIGVGTIGKMVIEILTANQLTVKVYDPFLPDDTAKALGVTKCGLAALFRECGVVSNHLADVPETVGFLTGDLFAGMKPYATFINTGRGAQVREDELALVLKSRPDLTALLDVTSPEPPEAGSPLYSLPNVFLTPHIAGSSGHEVERMSEWMCEEYLRIGRGEAPLWSVSLAMLDTMA